MKEKGMKTKCVFIINQISHILYRSSLSLSLISSVDLQISAYPRNSYPNILELICGVGIFKTLQKQFKERKLETSYNSPKRKRIYRYFK